MSLEECTHKHTHTHERKRCYLLEWKLMQTQHKIQLNYINNSQQAKQKQRHFLTCSYTSFFSRSYLMSLCTKQAGRKSGGGLSKHQTGIELDESVMTSLLVKIIMMPCCSWWEILSETTWQNCSKCLRPSSFLLFFCDMRKRKSAVKMQGQFLLVFLVFSFLYRLDWV